MHRIGVIGMGAIGRVILENMSKHPDFSVVCAWDLNPDICGDIADSFPDIDISTSPEALINDPRITAVYIATPPATHGDYVSAAIKAGKMILCEKPFGVDVEASGKLAAKVAASGLPNAINFNHGNAVSTTFIEAEMASGAMGAVAGIDIFIHLDQWPRKFQAHAAWLAGRAQGGFTREMLSHWIYLSTRLFGKAELWGCTVHYPGDITLSETYVQAQLTFGGTRAVINAAVGGAGPVGTQYTIWGAHKSYRLHSGGQVSSSNGGDWTPELGHIADIDREDHFNNLDAVAARFRGEDVNFATIADGFTVQKMVEKILAS